MAKPNNFAPELDVNGHEVPDQLALSLPSGFKRPETLAEQVQRLVRTSISLHAEQQGEETFDEADDFDVGDVDPTTPYEVVFDPVLGREVTTASIAANPAAYREAFVKRQNQLLAAAERARELERILGGEGGDPKSPPSQGANAPVTSPAGGLPPASSAASKTASPGPTG